MLIGKVSCVLLVLLATGGRGLESALADYSESGSFRVALEGRSMQETMSGPVDRDTSSYGERSSVMSPMSMGAPMLSIPANGNFGEQKQMRMQQVGPVGDEQQQKQADQGNEEQEEPEQGEPGAEQNSTPGLERESGRLGQSPRAGRLSARSRPAGAGGRRAAARGQAPRSSQQRAGPAMGPQFPTKEASFGESPRKQQAKQQPDQQEDDQQEQPEQQNGDQAEQQKNNKGPNMKQQPEEQGKQDENEQNEDQEQPDKQQPEQGGQESPIVGAKKSAKSYPKPGYMSMMSGPKANQGGSYNKPMMGYNKPTLMMMNGGGYQQAANNRYQHSAANKPPYMSPMMMLPQGPGMKPAAYSGMAAPMMNSYRAVPQPIAPPQQMTMRYGQQQSPARPSYPSMMMIQNGHYGGAMKAMGQGAAYMSMMQQQQRPAMGAPAMLDALVSRSQGPQRGNLRRANQRRGGANGKPKKMSPVMMNAMLNRLMSMKHKQEGGEQPEQLEQPESPMVGGQKKNKGGYKKMSMTEIMKSPAGAEMLAEMVMQQPGSMAHSMGPVKRAQFKRMMMAAIMKEAGATPGAGEQVQEPAPGQDEDEESDQEQGEEGGANKQGPIGSKKPTGQGEASEAEEGAGQNEEPTGEQPEQVEQMRMRANGAGYMKKNMYNNGGYKKNGAYGGKSRPGMRGMPEEEANGGEEEPMEQQRELPSNGRSAEMQQQKKEPQESEDGEEESPEPGNNGGQPQSEEPEQQQKVEPNGSRMEANNKKKGYLRGQAGRYGQAMKYANNKNQHQQQQKEQDEPNQEPQGGQPEEEGPASPMGTKGGPSAGGVKGGAPSDSQQQQPADQQQESGEETQQKQEDQPGTAKTPAAGMMGYSSGGGLPYGTGAAPMAMAEPFDFGYKVDDHYGNKQYRKESGNNNGAVKGSYGYQDKSGIYRHVEYVADENGFRAAIKSNEPGLSPEQRPPSPMMSFMNAQKQQQMMIQPQEQQQQNEGAEKSK